MVKAVFDTNILIDFLRGRSEAEREISRYENNAISIVTWMEIMVGATPETDAGTRAFLASFETIQLDEAIAQEAVDLRRQYRMKLPDAVVWASARRGGRLLVTRNSKDFPSNNPGVRLPYAF